MWPKGVYVDDLPLSVEDEQGRWVMADSDTIALSALGFIGANDKQAFTELGWDDRLQYSPVDLWNKVMEGVSQKVVVSLTVAPDKLEALLRAAEDIGADIISPTSE